MYWTENGIFIIFNFFSNHVILKVWCFDSKKITKILYVAVHFFKLDSYLKTLWYANLFHFSAHEKISFHENYQYLKDDMLSFTFLGVKITLWVVFIQKFRISILYIVMKTKKYSLFCRNVNPYLSDLRTDRFKTFK